MYHIQTHFIQAYAVVNTGRARTQTISIFILFNIILIPFHSFRLPIQLDPFRTNRINYFFFFVFLRNSFSRWFRMEVRDTEGMKWVIEWVSERERITLSQRWTKRTSNWIELNHHRIEDETREKKNEWTEIYYFFWFNWHSDGELDGPCWWCEWSSCWLLLLTMLCLAVWFVPAY